MKGSLRERWCAEVARTSAVTDSVKVLLLVLAVEMRENGYVSVPRLELCRRLDRRERVVSERLAQAVNAKLLDRVQRGQKGRTAVYRALLPDAFSRTNHSTLTHGRRSVQQDEAQHPEGTVVQHPDTALSGPPGARASSRSEHKLTGFAAVPPLAVDDRNDGEKRKSAGPPDPPRSVVRRAERSAATPVPSPPSPATSGGLQEKAVSTSPPVVANVIPLCADCREPMLLWDVQPDEQYHPTCGPAWAALIQACGAGGTTA